MFSLFCAIPSSRTYVSLLRKGPQIGNETMPTYAQQMNRLKRIISIAEKLIADTPKPQRGRQPNGSGAVLTKRIRRSGKELNAFRHMLKTERKRGIPVAKLAHRHGISAAYIYQL
jgi:hypothetical protein